MLPRTGGGLSRRKGDKGSSHGGGGSVLARRCLTCFILVTVVILMSWTLYGMSSFHAAMQQQQPQPIIVGQPQPNNLRAQSQSQPPHVPDKNTGNEGQVQPPLDSPEEIRKAQAADMDTNEPIPLLDEEQLNAMENKQQQQQQGNEQGENENEEEEEGLEFEKAVADERQKKKEQQVLVLSFSSQHLPPHSALRITLRPDLSPDSVEYIHEILKQGCERCKFYRAEKPGILQGIMANEHVAVAKERGPCPAGLESIENECPAWDPNCGCHGPLMERGMVGWAAGETGPDFFINDYRKRADFWGTQHTVFGRIVDDASFTLLDTIFDMPVHKAGLTMLDEELKFTMHIE
jgi:cyclophilin family peptidyl-prolyl cis-trans isomerase